MSTLELSSYLLEIPNDAYSAQSILIGCSTLSQEYCKLIQLILEIEHKHALFLSFSGGIQVSLTRCSYKISPLVICQKAKPIQIENWTM